jgi:hypothetical protein
MMDIGASFSDPRLFGEWFAGASWNGWKAVLRGAFAEKMTKRELAFFHDVAKRDPPPHRVKELWCIVGRRGGKDSVASGVVSHIAASFDPAGKLRPGERALCACLAVDKAQAAIVLNYVRAFFERVPSLEALVERETASGFLLSNMVEVSVLAADFRSLRGRTTLCCVADEIAYWRGEFSTRPDKEVLRAIRPSMLTLKESMFIAISTAYRRDGALYEAWARHFGRDTATTLVIQAPSTALNPTLPASEIDAALAEDPEAARADYLSEWRDNVSGYLPRDLIEGAVDAGVTVRQPDPRFRYTSFIDASSGQQDSFSCAICHAEEQAVVLDCLVEIPAPFSTSAAVMQVAATLKCYSIYSTCGDDHAKGWVIAELGRNGIRFEPRPTEMTRSALYSETLPLFSSGRVRLLDSKRLVSQYCALERRLLPGGHERIDHPNRSGHHDDLANACAGALWRASQAQGVTVSPELLNRITSMAPRREQFAGTRSSRRLMFNPPADRIDYGAYHLQHLTRERN